MLALLPILKTLIARYWVYALGVAALVVAFWAYHHHVYDQGYAACEAEHIGKNLEVKNVQQDIEAKRPRSRAELIDRLRNDPEF